LDRLLRRQKCPKSQPRIHTAFEKAMILFHCIIQIFALPQGTRLPERSIRWRASAEDRQWLSTVMTEARSYGSRSHFAESAPLPQHPGSHSENRVSALGIYGLIR
jgi:hypothetical protein